jgi:hypothetical protein
MQYGISLGTVYGLEDFAGPRCSQKILIKRYIQKADPTPKITKKHSLFKLRKSNSENSLSLRSNNNINPQSA